VLTVPAVAVKVAVVKPLGTVTIPGTRSADVLLDSVTGTPPNAAALERTSVHEALPPEVRLVGVQDTELIEAAARRETDAVCELPL
jgi:hypothetical protein